MKKGVTIFRALEMINKTLKAMRTENYFTFDVVGSDSFNQSLDPQYYMNHVCQRAEFEFWGGYPFDDLSHVSPQ